MPNANLDSPDINSFVIDLKGASDVSAVDLTTTLSPGIIPVWLAVGPLLNDGSYLLLTGMDNDYFVTQNS